ncbi:glycerate kinase [Mycobacterium frederiksbergense]|uniref:Glycerate kinase n=1 Tax=Mycolicibacterium frederiksbergense TaxID=117567 RepID=A0ABT6L6X3_9MYCO|nr:glycerate kinase [Mycolicibacterium frederiksbergense]MDH6198675.1 glycerate kinase [Mycolicibacterium frederiksbergense]
MNRDRARIVLAPDKFKGSLAADEVVAAMALGCADLGMAEHCVPLPIADGGDGSVEAALRAGWTARRLPTVDAWGQSVTTTAAIQEDRAIVEVASICGMSGAHLTPQCALTASSHGVGVAIRALLDDGIREITVSLGGSATTDGGAGMLAALGMKLRDAAGDPIEPTGVRLLSVADVDASGLDPRLSSARLTMACDVDNPMVGIDGSAEVFARQKGADDDGIRLLSASLVHLAAKVEPAVRQAGLHCAPGSGAAGGLAWAGMVLGAEVRSGAGLFLEMLGARGVIDGAQLVLTGEGSLDAQSLRGKGPVAVAALAAELRVPTVAVVGTNRLKPTDIGSPFIDVIALDRIDRRCADEPAVTRALLRKATTDLLTRHLTSPETEFEGAQ